MRLGPEDVGGWCLACGIVELYRDGNNEHYYPKLTHPSGKKNRDNPKCECKIQQVWRLTMHHVLYWCPKCGARKFGAYSRWEYPALTAPEDNETTEDIGEAGTPLFGGPNADNSR